MSEIVLIFFGALLGAVFGGGMSAWMNRRRMQLQTTLALLTEWNSAEMQRNRLIAHRALRPVDSLIEALARTGDEETERAITAIVHFWEKAAILDEYNETKRTLFKTVFAEMAQGWITRLFGLSSDPNDYDGWAGHARPILKLATRL